MKVPALLFLTNNYKHTFLLFINYMSKSSEKTQQRGGKFIHNFYGPINNFFDNRGTLNYSASASNFSYEKNKTHSKPTDEPNTKQLDKQMLARAIEHCQQFFWGKSSYAVVYCICRDVYHMNISKPDFETMIEELPYKNKRSHICTTGSISNAFTNNPIFNENISEWDAKASSRIIVLRDELLKS